MFAQAFEDSGRPDLAACVRNRKFYQRLSIIIGDVPDFDMLKGFVHAARSSSRRRWRIGSRWQRAGSRFTRRSRGS